METHEGDDARYARKVAAKVRDRRDTHLEDVSMAIKLLQPGGEGGIAARITKTTLDVRPKPDL